MPYSQVKRLLKKKRWTGKEVGQLLIASLLNDIKQQEQAEKKPLFTQSEFEDMERSITTDKEYSVYGVYKDLYASIIDSYNRGQAIYQQFYNGYNRLNAMIRELRASDATQEIEDNTPLIMTAEQYEREKAQATEEFKGYMMSYADLIYYALSMFLQADEEAIKKEAPAVWEALEATKNIPADNNRYARLYNIDHNKGYRLYTDGRRSDQMTEEELEEANSNSVLLDGVPMKGNDMLYTKIAEGDKLFYEGAEAVREYIKNRTGEPLEELSNEDLLDEWAITLNFLGGEKIAPSPYSELFAEALGASFTFEWVPYEEIPEGITLYDILPTYSEAYKEDLHADAKQSLDYLKADAPELYKAIKEYVERTVPQAKGIKRNQLSKYIISYGELAETDYIGSLSLITPTDQDIVNAIVNRAVGSGDATGAYRKYNKAKRKGIALIQNPQPSQVDKNGDYIEGESFTIYHADLYSTEKDQETIDNLHAFKERLVYPALSYMYAFNALMEIIGTVYDLPELPKIAQYDTSDLEERCTSFNTYLYYFYRKVYGARADKEHKREIIKTAFSPLEPAELLPSEDTKEEIAEELTELGFTKEARMKIKYLDPLIDRLIYGF